MRFLMILMMGLMIAANVTPSIAAINCRQFGEATVWIYEIYRQDRPISDVMDVIDSRGLDGLTKEQSRELALYVHKWMDNFPPPTAKETRDFFERSCFEAKYN